MREGNAGGPLTHPVLHKGKGEARYWVVEKPTDNPKRDGASAILYEVRWLGSDKVPPVATLMMGDATSRLTFHPNPTFAHNPKVQKQLIGSLYNDAMRGVQLAFEVAFKGLEKRRRAAAREANKQSNVDKVTEGYDLDLNRTAARRVLKSCRWRKRKGGGVEIYYKRKWLHLCRTDLIDDVRTWTSSCHPGNPHHINHYSNTVAYGARITADAFYIVDALSDG